MNNRLFFLIVFVCSLLLTIWVKMNRADYFGINPWLDVLLGSAPSFLLVTTLSSSLVVFANNLQPRKLVLSILSLSVGALAWEFETIGISENLIFDWNDVLAIVLAAILMLALSKFNHHEIKKG